MKTLKQTLRPLRRLYDHLQNQRPKQSFSQSGEDIIVKFIFYVLGIKTPAYLDIGAYHPRHFSNTFLFYKEGASGICIEPDPELCQYFQKKRPRDKCINVGVGIDNQVEANFYLMTPRTLNTFSQEEAEKATAMGRSISKVVKVPLKGINELIAENFSGRCPNFISLDIEGLDFEVLKTFDFAKHRPQVFCIETLTYSETRTGKKLTNIIEYMKHKNYFVYADTYINTIFVDVEAWKFR